MTDEAKGHDDRLTDFMAEGNGLFTVHFIGADNLGEWFERASEGDPVAVKFQIAMGRMALQARAGRGCYCVRCQRQRFTGNIPPLVFIFGVPEVPDPKNVMFGGVCEACCDGLEDGDLTRIMLDYCQSNFGPARQIEIGAPGRA